MMVSNRYSSLETSGEVLDTPMLLEEGAGNRCSTTVKRSVYHRRDTLSTLDLFKIIR